MNATNKLLDKCIALCVDRKGSPCTNTELAAMLGVKRTALANYQSGTSKPAPHVIRRLAEMIGENPDHWMALVESERAKDAEDRKAWAAMARRLGTAAAVGVVALYLSDHAPTLLEAAALTPALTMHYANFALVAVALIAALAWWPRGRSPAPVLA